MSKASVRRARQSRVKEGDPLISNRRRERGKRRLDRGVKVGTELLGRATRAGCPG